jgi:hypothetical protein
MWPAVWMAFFFGTWGTAFIIGWVGVAHGAALLALPPEMSNIDRWIDAWRRLARRPDEGGWASPRRCR